MCFAALSKHGSSEAGRKEDHDFPSHKDDVNLYDMVNGPNVYMSVKEESPSGPNTYESLKIADVTTDIPTSDRQKGVN